MYTYETDGAADACNNPRKTPSEAVVRRPQLNCLSRTEGGARSLRLDVRRVHWRPGGARVRRAAAADLQAWPVHLGPGWSGRPGQCHRCATNTHCVSHTRGSFISFLHGTPFPRLSQAIASRRPPRRLGCRPRRPLSASPLLFDSARVWRSNLNSPPPLLDYLNAGGNAAMGGNWTDGDGPRCPLKGWVGPR